MTAAALLSRRNVNCRLASGGSAIVAGAATTGDSTVAEGGRYPRNGGMADGALLNGGDVCAALADSGWIAAVVTAAATTGDTGVSECGWNPCSR